MKFRLVRRAQGWVIQTFGTSLLNPDVAYKWVHVSTHRWRLLAALRLVWLRERNRET